MLSEVNANEADMSEASEVEMMPLLVRNRGRDTETSAESSSGSCLEQHQQQQQMVVTVPPFRGDLASPLDSPFGGAVSLFNATGAAMMGMRQTLLTGPPAVWQGSVTRVRPSLVI